MGENLIAMLTCKEVSRSIASDDVGDERLLRRLAMKFHLLMCRHCRRYSRQMQQIGSAAREVFGGAPAEPGSRQRLRNSILDRISHVEKDDSDPRV